MHQFNPKGEYKVGQRRAKEFVAKKAEGGRMKSPLSAPAPEPIKIGAPGSIEELGAKTYFREVGRDPVSKRFGKYPYTKVGRE